MKEFKCDCGFKWLEGKSGSHNCGPFYMEKVDGLRQELAGYKAHCEELTVSLAYLIDAINCEDENATDWVDTAEREAKAVLAKTPKQSLAKVRANAVLDLIKEKSEVANVDGITTGVIHENDALDYSFNLLGDTK